MEQLESRFYEGVLDPTSSLAKGYRLDASGHRIEQDEEEAAKRSRQTAVVLRAVGIVDPEKEQP